jgi:hypothetical protein
MALLLCGESQAGWGQSEAAPISSHHRLVTHCRAACVEGKGAHGLAQ